MFAPFQKTTARNATVERCKRADEARVSTPAFFMPVRLRAKRVSYVFAIFCADIRGTGEVKTWRDTCNGKKRLAMFTRLNQYFVLSKECERYIPGNCKSASITNVKAILGLIAEKWTVCISSW